MIKAVIFDFFGVIGASVYRLVAEKVDIKPENLEKISDLHRALDNGFINQTEFFEQYAGLCNMPLDDFLDVYHDSDKRFAVSDKLIDYIGQLKKNGYKIALLSNVSQEAYEEFVEPVVKRGIFDVVVTSYQYGLAKPDQAIFEICSRQLGLDTAECLMVDDIQANCDGAVSVGMNAIRYATFEEFKPQIEKYLIQ